MDPESNGNSFDAADEPVPDTPAVTLKPRLLDGTGGWMRLRYPHGLYLAVLLLAIIVIIPDVYVHS